MLIKDLTAELENIAPFSLAMDFDNAGLICGDENDSIKNAGVCLDITDKVISEAIELNVNTIVSHHPMIFKPLKKIIKGNAVSDKIIKCIQNNINVIAMHTNLDVAKNGINDTLAEIIGLYNIYGYNKYINDEKTGQRYFALIGNFNEMPILNFIEYVKTVLDADHIKTVIKKNKVKKVAVCCGSGAGFLSEVYKENVDTIISGDISHDEFIDLSHCGMNIIDAGHYHTEKIIVPKLAKIIKNFGINTYELNQDDAQILII